MPFRLDRETVRGWHRFHGVHCGINLYTIERLRKQGYRYGGLVSKGGVSMVAWMLANNRENPLYERFDRVVEILKKYDNRSCPSATGLRAGAIHDSSDRAPDPGADHKLRTRGDRPRDGVPGMLVEGPGHVPLDEIAGNIQLQKRMSGARLTTCSARLPPMLPPVLITSQQHRRGAILRFGADLICYITPCRTPGAPNEEDVRQGVNGGQDRRLHRRHEQVPGKRAGAGPADSPKGAARPRLGETVRACLYPRTPAPSVPAAPRRMKRPAPCAVIFARRGGREAVCGGPARR